ncbi:hypothetical protein D6C86_10588 [Aureobasidium pullulans]|uniref:HAT C-terminal dimerisation domain-containing protein n=1 Tax=Aureobasidium pullulans TaxID=5580 RepID=A0A4S9VGE8_AURPU|nr:hypothetical protein D6C94_10722 [Aureobasidium pullulans]THZ51099.1 hypothetical protein D6C86_10588 [Aureobasidium pullulans]
MDQIQALICLDDQLSRASNAHKQQSLLRYETRNAGKRKTIVPQAEYQNSEGNTESIYAASEHEESDSESLPSPPARRQKKTVPPSCRVPRPALPTPPTTEPSQTTPETLLNTADIPSVTDEVTTDLLRPQASFRKQPKERIKKGDGKELFSYSRHPCGDEPGKKRGKRICHGIKLSTLPEPLVGPIDKLLGGEKLKKQAEVAFQNQLRNLVDANAAKELLITLITRNHLPFRFVEHQEFHQPIAMFNPAAADILVKGHTTVARHIERLYHLQQDQLRQSIAQFKSQIHFTTDSWTSNYGNLEPLAVTGRWVTPDGRLSKALLNLHNLPDGHAGKLTAPYLFKTIKSLGIKNPGYITSDNASCNDTMMAELSKLLASIDIDWDPVQCRTRCFGHQNNLIPQAFWNHATEEAIEHARVYNPNDVAAVIARKDTGWAADQSVRLLECLMKTMKTTSAIIAMDYLRVHYDEATTEHAGNTPFLTALQSSRYVYESWYAVNDRTPAYQSAILLHPSYRLAYVDHHWPDDWIDKAKQAARSLYKRQYYKPPLPAPTPISTSPQAKRGFKDWKQSITLVRKVTDEFDHFVRGDPLPIDNPLQWWLEAQQQRQYPNLARMAIDILSVNPMSAESERVLSSFRRAIPWDRAQISAEHVEMVECLKSWKKHQKFDELPVQDAEYVDIEELCSDDEVAV